MINNINKSKSFNIQTKKNTVTSVINKTNNCHFVKKIQIYDGLVIKLMHMKKRKYMI